MTAKAVITGRPYRKNHKQKPNLFADFFIQITTTATSLFAHATAKIPIQNPQKKDLHGPIPINGVVHLLLAHAPFHRPDQHGTRRCRRQPTRRTHRGGRAVAFPV